MKVNRKAGSCSSWQEMDIYIYIIFFLETQYFFKIYKS